MVNSYLEKHPSRKRSKEDLDELDKQNKVGAGRGGGKGGRGKGGRGEERKYIRTRILVIGLYSQPHTLFTQHHTTYYTPNRLYK